jgi:hypothetical protein
MVAWVGAVLSSLCRLLPLAIIVLGLGSGAFMAVTVQYRWILIPLGVLGVITGFALYARERRRCDAMACRMAGSRVTLALLIVDSCQAETRRSGDHHCSERSDTSSRGRLGIQIRFPDSQLAS